jgi:hypothetical protein
MTVTDANQPPYGVSPFQSFFMGGFECSTHKRADGKRLDLIGATQHDVRARDDYQLLAAHGMRTIRDGVRWHLIEGQQGRYRFDSFLPMLRAANKVGTQVIWDLLHYGYPDWLDPWSPSFVDRAAAFARGIATVVRDESDQVPFYTPVNEISFWAWGGGDVGYLNPFSKERGDAFKIQLIRAAIAMIGAIRDVDPRARIVSAEPLIHVHPRSTSARDRTAADSYNFAQHDAQDAIAGRRWPHLGGRPEYLDLVGLNFYANGQWIEGSQRNRVVFSDARFRPLRHLLADAYAHHQASIFIAETGIEGDERAPWLRYVATEVQAARAAGIPVEGICLYPILNHLGWDDDRYCPNGLFDGAAPNGVRTVYPPLAEELLRWQSDLAR